MPSIVLFQPEIPANLATVLRFAAGCGVQVHIVEPCGFIWDPEKIKRIVMDYARLDDVVRHACFADLQSYVQQNQGRLIAFTTKAQLSFWDFSFHSQDFLIFGQESAGLPTEVHAVVDGAVKLPQSLSTRSHNLATSVIMGTSEVLRQCSNH